MMANEDEWGSSLCQDKTFFMNQQLQTTGIPAIAVTGCYWKCYASSGIDSIKSSVSKAPNVSIIGRITGEIA